MTARPRRPWVIVASYPSWPSPYFAEIARHAPANLNLEFASDLDALTRRSGPAGVINLHRLKRLYRQSDGTRTVEAADRMLHRLNELRWQGWYLVWTVHNLLPVDGPPPGEADYRAAHGVLGLADAVITHTRADADHLSRLTSAPVTIAGWGGITARSATPATAPHRVAELADRMAHGPMSILVLGNLTPYKDPRGVIDAFIRHSRSSRLFLVGPCHEEGVVRDLTAAAQRSNGRIQVHLERIAPEYIGALYQAADAALCPYRTDGPWEFFYRILYPSSVATAVEFALPVIAPDLPPIREITDGHPRLLYPPAAGPSAVLGAAEEHRWPQFPADQRHGWRAVMAAYVEVSRTLLPMSPPAPRIT